VSGVIATHRPTYTLNSITTQVATFLGKILADPSCEAVTFPLHTVKKELAAGDEGTAHQEKLIAVSFTSRLLWYFL
jgi:hypothetical protein